MINILLALGLAVQAIPTIADDVARFASCATNEERFAALTTMLTSRKLAFTVEPFKIERPLRGEPRTEGRNVVVTLGEVRKEIVIGAHYDAARLPDGSLSKGAVDNAASTVMLVRLAEVLAVEKLPVRIRLVWFDMEELGLIGSQQYVQNHTSDSISAMLNFDINAYGNTILFGPSDRQDNVELRRTLLQTCALEDAACVSFPQMPPGDDRTFVKAGIQTLSLGVLPAVEVHQVWLMMNAGANSGLSQGAEPPIFRTIHTADDTPDKVSEATVGMMLRFTTSLVKNLARR